MAAALDVNEVRGSFPGLAGGNVYFDNAGGSQTLGAVAERIRDYLVNTNVQLGASYATSKEATKRYYEGYTAAAEYIGASAEEVALGPSTTQLFYNVSYALNFEEGDEIIVSIIDHEANIAPWVLLAERQKLILKWWHPNNTTPDAKTNPKLLASDLPALLTPKTRLVTCTHASNILGTIHDIGAISRTVHTHSPNALVCVDAVAYAPHRQIDVRALGADLYAFSWYKVYGPHLAMLYASPRALAALRSLGHFFKSHRSLEDKLGLAAAGYELVHALPAVAAYLDGRWDAIAAHECRLQQTLLDWLDARGEEVTVYGERGAGGGGGGDADVRVPTVSFTVRGWGSRALVERVEAESKGVVGFRWGGFYSQRLVGEVLGLGKEGVVRVSMVHYNTVDEVKTLIALLEKVLDENSPQTKL
ncbi:pyridoxal phosphate-dependent transferase [Chaetomium fimeti]|uniref:Pyridoxal phosphate-dependent transferase n=1 Tax=Chaetomium fimeti TaxID=1854472 RepID=A0AAE0HMD7_9PEZI|nr:pyridoxal phosphate-dependent transferase [Chaetomium fimeti]